MKLPFTSEEFLKVFEKYNLAIWPLQYVLVIIAVIAILSGIKRTPRSAKYISIVLSFLWLWMGIVYHLLFFTHINKAAYLFGAGFIIQGVLFLITGVFRNQLSFRFKNDFYGVTGAVFIVFALVIYPVIGYLMKHVYPSTPTFGLPCPTTIFTFGILLWMDKRCPLYILIIPFLWSLIGFAAALSLGIKEDTGLLITGLLTVTLIFVKNKKEKKFSWA